MKSFLTILAIVAIQATSFCQVQIGNDIDGENIQDLSGHSVAISANGSIVAIGAIENDDGGNRSGHLRVYENIGGTWTQIGQDIAGEAQDDGSGYSLAISADGSVVAIGSILNNFWRGQVEVYKNIAGTWAQIGSDIEGDNSQDVSATSISLSSNGDIIAIGTPRADSIAVGAGHVRVLENVGGAWIQLGGDILGSSTDEWTGNSVALNGLGNIVAVGASQNDDNGTNAGEVKIYEYQGGNWIQIGGDIDGTVAWEYSGHAVALSDSGNIVAISSPSSDINGLHSGLVRVYENTGGIWTQIGLDIQGQAAEDWCGFSLALSASGNIIAIGSIWNDNNGNDAGNVRIFQNLGGVWTQMGVDINGELANDNSGVSVDISADGNTVAIGAKFNDGNGTSSGHVRVFDLSSIILSIPRFDLENIVSIFPNPSKDVINITSKTDMILKTELYSLEGSLIFKTDIKANTYSLDFADYPSGFYFLKIFGQNSEIQNSKIIIN